MASSIINSDDGVVSGTSGLKTTGGDDGVLVFQSKGTETARINTDKQIVAAAGTASLPALTTTGDVNTGIFFPAADTIAFAEGGAEAMRITSDGRLGLGTTTPGYNQTIFGSGNTFLQFSQSGDSVAGTLIGRAGSTSLRIQNSENAATEFWTNNTERARITSDGYLRMASGSGGIQFNGDTAAANALDDYEEGTWTGSVLGLTTNPTTPVTATGTYTKIGRQVFARIAFTAFNTTGASGGFYVSGLPFSTAQAVATGNVMAYDFLTYAGGQNLSPYLSGTSIFVYYMVSNGVWSPATHNPGSGRYLDISVTYNV